MNGSSAATAAGRTGRWLLTQNSRLKRERIFNWSLPAWAGRLPDGRTYNTCPEAGVCASSCYARHGSYRWPVVLAAHQRNLQMILDTPLEWEERMTAEVQHPRYAQAWIRCHDSGDFFSDEYLEAWLRIMRVAPEGVRFYAYTKAVSRFRRVVLPDPPANFLWCFSLGGREDQLIDLAVDRHADVFPTLQALEAAGYSDQSASDLLSVLSESPKVGIPANRIPGTAVRRGPSSFGDLQRQDDSRRTERRAGRPRPAGPFQEDQAA